MKPALDKTTPRSNEKESESLGPVWAIFGCGLFVIALSVPIATVQYFPAQDADGITGDAAVKATEQIVDAGKASDIPGQSTQVVDPLRAMLAVSEIEPGRGVGDIRLGDALEQTLDVLPKPSYTSFETDGTKAEHVYGFTLGPTDFEIRAVGEVQRVTSLSLSVRDCHALLYYQPRQEGIPSTVDGLSIGSHQSRVIAQYGEPLAGKPRAPIPGPMLQPIKQNYPGMNLVYCPDYNLLREIAVVEMPKEPVAEPLVAEKQPTEPQVSEPVIAAIDDTPPTVMPGPDAIASAQGAGADAVPLIAGTGLAGGKARGETQPQGLAEPNALADLTNPTALQPLAGQLTEPPARAPDLTSDVEVDTAHRLAVAPPTPEPGIVSGSAAEALATPDETLSTAPSVVAEAAPPPNYAAGGDDRQDFAPGPDGTDDLNLAPEDSAVASGQPKLDRLVGPSLAELWVPGGTYEETVQRSAALGSAPAEAEQELALTQGERRRLQIRMRLMGHNPKGIDGVFGPNTREAIYDVQSAANLPTTGYIDAETRSLILDKSQVAYRDWVRSLPKRQARETAPLTMSRMPVARNAPECKRDESGTIISNQSWDCDVTVLQEGLRSLTSLFDVSVGDIASKDVSG